MLESSKQNMKNFKALLEPQYWKKQSMFEGLPTAQMPSSSQFASMQRRPCIFLI
uniref:Uncharacterized protein n=1 Tax=Meloidogyne enterolobii TaxID=390850 RepID=A0A6V7U2Z5_MELEN|nr:unnamed protein product [Meloidogyne enterolobii]